MEFSEQFCLKSRDSFIIETAINPEDRKFYFGREELRDRIKHRLLRSFIRPGTPKLFLYGAYGSGKTQTLAHIGYLLENERPRSLKDELTVFPVEVVLEMAQKSSASQFHLQLVEALGKDKVCSWVEELFSRSSNFETELEELFPADSNLVQCVKTLRGGGEMPMTAWRWLSGRKLSSAEQQRVQTSGNLGEVGIQDFVKVLVGFGRLAERLGEKLVFLVDECECLNRIQDTDAAESVHTMIRQLSDLQNSYTGFILATYGNDHGDMPQILMRDDVVTRINNINILEIETIEEPADARKFMLELLAEIVDQDAAEQLISKNGLNSSREIFPFQPDAFDQFCNFATANPGIGTPRNIIDCLNECAIAAWDNDSQVIDDQMVDELAPLVFSDNR